jgi:hypothetical protein
MKKKIAFLLAALILTGVILFFLQALLMPKYMDNPDGALIAEYYQNAGNHDVIFIGDCEVYENFSPITLWEEYGITSYIRGSPQQLAWQSYYLMEETLKYEKPKVFVFNVLSLKYDTPDSTTEQSHREEYNRMALDGMRWSASKWNAIGASLSKDERKDKLFTYASYLFPILRYHDRWSQLTADDFKYLFTRDEVSHNGYLMNVGVKPRGTHNEAPVISGLGENSMSYLQKMADLCKENGVTLVLIKAPTDNPTWHDRWDKDVRAFAKENSLTYLDMRNIDEMGLDWATDTHDGGEHLNVYGAEKATRWFGAWLKKNFNIQWTQHDDTVSALWAEKCATYHSHKKELEEK